MGLELGLGLGIGIGIASPATRGAWCDRTRSCRLLVCRKSEVRSRPNRMHPSPRALSCTPSASSGCGSDLVRVRVGFKVRVGVWVRVRVGIRGRGRGRIRGEGRTIVGRRIGSPRRTVAPG